MNTPSRALRLAAVPLMLIGGALVAVQSHINGELAHEMGTGLRAGIGAAVISFGSGLVLVFAIVALIPHGMARAKDLVHTIRTGRLRPVEVIGGLFGAFLVASQGITVGTIGVALFSVCVTAGQSASGLIVDHLGIGPSGHQPLSISRFVAATFAIAAVILAAGERLLDTWSWKVAIFALLPLVAGAGSAVQQALNGRVSSIAGPWVTTLNNFVVGTTALLVVFAASFLVSGDLTSLPHDWWLYLGGAMGVGFISLAALLVRVHGVLVLGLSMIAGQVIAALIIDVTIDEAHVGTLGIVGGGLTVVGVLIALLLRPRHTAHAAL